MQSFVAKLGYKFPTPYEIRCVNILDLANTDLSKYAQVYCEKYVEAPLLAYADYRKLPNIALRMKPEEVKVGDCVEIMTRNISDVKFTARGVVMQSSGATQNGINLSKQSFLINGTEVFDSMFIVHFPEMSSGHRCKCGRKEHRLLGYLCDVTTLNDFGSAPFHIIETAYRLQKVNPDEHEEVKIARKKKRGCCY